MENMQLELIRRDYYGKDYMMLPVAEIFLSSIWCWSWFCEAFFSPSVKAFFSPDPKAAIILKQHKLELWPGYVTSIRQHVTEKLYVQRKFRVTNKCFPLQQIFHLNINLICILTKLSNKQPRVFIWTVKGQQMVHIYTCYSLIYLNIFSSIKKGNSRAGTVACLGHHRVYNFLSEPKPLSQPTES